MNTPLETLHEYRITLAHLYGPENRGHDDPSRRQGHYVIAKDPFTAVQVFTKGRRGVKASDRFDIQYWKELFGRPSTEKQGTLLGRYHVDVCPHCLKLTKVIREDV